MVTPTPTAAYIERLADSYAQLRHPDNQTPAQLLRTFQREMNQTVLSYIESLDHRSRNVYDALCDFARHVTSKDKESTDAISNDAKRAESTGKEVIQEIEQIKRELDRLPDKSPKREQLGKALELRMSELDFQVRRLEAAKQKISASQDSIEQLIPSVGEIQVRVQGLQGRFSKSMFRLTIAGIGTKLILLVPAVFALVTTITLDRATPILELLTQKLTPKGYHDIVLLILFALQIIGLTPLTDSLISKLCWKRFDRAMSLLRSVLGELRPVEIQITEAEQFSARLSEGPI